MCDRTKLQLRDLPRGLDTELLLEVNYPFNVIRGWNVKYNIIRVNIRDYVGPGGSPIHRTILVIDHDLVGSLICLKGHISVIVRILRPVRGIIHL